MDSSSYSGIVIYNISFKLSHDIVCWQLVAGLLLVLSPLALCLDRGFFPVAVGFIRRVPVLGSILNLPGISTVSTRVPSESRTHASASLRLSSKVTHHMGRPKRLVVN